LPPRKHPEASSIVCYLYLQICQSEALSSSLITMTTDDLKSFYQYLTEPGAL
jgi:hypothetical protein